MLKKVINCSCYSKTDGVNISVCEKDGKAVITKGEEAKQADIRALRNLDIFFNDIELIAFSDDDIPKNDYFTVEFDGDKSVYTLNDGKLLSELYYYFNSYFNNTAKPFTLSFNSFEGGGPEYYFENEKTGIFTWYCEKRYYSDDHEELCGAGFDVIYNIYPLRAGEATALIKGESPICPRETKRLFVKVFDDLSTEYRLEEINGADDGF